MVRGEESIIGGEEEKPEPKGLIDYPTSDVGITTNGTTTIDVVKIKTNTTSISGIKFANSYTKDGVSNGNNAELTVEGGFKAGDVLTIAGAYNNADTTKISAVDVFTLAIVNDDPVVETYTLTADADKLFIGRNGNTGTFVTFLRVERGTTTGIQTLKVKVQGSATFNLAGRKVEEGYKGIVIRNGKKMMR